MTTPCTPKDWFRIEPVIQAAREAPIRRNEIYRQVGIQLRANCQNYANHAPCRTCADFGLRAVAQAVIELAGS